MILLKTKRRTKILSLFFNTFILPKVNFLKEYNMKETFSVKSRERSPRGA